VNGPIDFPSAMRRNAAIAACVAIATILATLVITAAQTRVYEASAQLVVSPAVQTSDTSDVIRSVETLERRTVVATFARFASTPETRNLAARRAGIAAEAIAQYETHGSVMPSTNIIRVEASGPDPERVAALANAAAAIAAQQAQTLYRVYALQLLSRATAPDAPVRPDRKRNILVGVTLAIFLSAVSALAADRLRASHVREPLP
jgi:capsular polysaccharide biosynthesis protein